MEVSFVFIDYENIQPEKISLLNRKQFRLIIFAGDRQNISDLEELLQPFGKKANIKRIAPGRNSLDFHIAFYLGQISASEPGANFFIVSKDKDYDTLINHLHSLNINVARVTNVREIYEHPAVKVNISPQKISFVSDIKPSPIEETIEKQYEKMETISAYADIILCYLYKMRDKPQTLASLTKTISHVLSDKELAIAHTNDILIRMINGQLISINKETEKITYNFDNSYWLKFDDELVN
jgi:hypothetical protein